MIVAHYDNSSANRYNPDPTAAVKWGEQTWEEMLIGYFGTIEKNDAPVRSSAGRKSARGKRKSGSRPPASGSPPPSARGPPTGPPRGCATPPLLPPSAAPPTSTATPPPP